MVSPARFEAFSILMELEPRRGGKALAHAHAHSNDLLRGARVSALSEPDRKLATALVMGVLRWQIFLDEGVRKFLSKPNARLDAGVRMALRLGAFQLLFLDRIPAHAAIGESVELAKLSGHTFAARMVNAVLRMVAGEAKPGEVPVALAEEVSAQGMARVSAHPEWMVGRWVQRLGVDAAKRICAHGQREAGLQVRLASSESEAELAVAGVVLEPGRLLTSARRVVAGDGTSTAAFREGRVRIQDEGSQLIAELASGGSGAGRILDCCAAPGGKTLVLAERNPGARVTALEVSPARLEALRERMAASRDADRIEVRLGDAERLGLEGGEAMYDLVLADVPCSGTGTLGRNPEIRHRLQLADLARLHEKQCGILRGALRVGVSRVVYSTCSLEAEENSEVVAEVLKEVEGWRRLSVDEILRRLAERGVLADGALEILLSAVNETGELMLFPGMEGVETDGFFAAVLERV